MVGRKKQEYDQPFCSVATKCYRKSLLIMKTRQLLASPPESQYSPHTLCTSQPSCQVAAKYMYPALVVVLQFLRHHLSSLSSTAADPYNASSSSPCRRLCRT